MFASSSAAGTPVRFLIVRHGETNYNADGRVQGTLESKLTEKGQDQAAALGEWMVGAEPSIGYVLVSIKRRTQQTLEGFSPTFVPSPRHAFIKNSHSQVSQRSIEGWLAPLQRFVQV